MIGKMDQILNRMGNILPLWLWLIIPMAFALVSFLTLDLLEKLWIKRVRESSEKYRWMLTFNQNWHFNKIKKVYTFTETVKTRAELKKCDFQQVFSDIVRQNSEMLWDCVQKTNSNRDMLVQYKTALQQTAVKTSESTIKRSGVPKLLHSKYEEGLCRNQELSPQTDVLVRVIVEKKGKRVSKKKCSAIFDSENIKKELSSVWDDKVRDHSTKLQKLLGLNRSKATIIEPFEAVYHYEKNCANTNEFRKYAQSNLFMKEVISDDFEEFVDRLRKAKTNKATETVYIESCSQIKSTDTNEIRAAGVPESYFIQCEDKLFDDAKTSAPIMSFNCNTVVYYRSPKGRNQSQDFQQYTFDEIRDLVDAIKKERIRKNAYYQSRAIERSKMTNSLRYDVMKRDGFRCTLCGASIEDGAKLHVDHIMPVAKGGKTEMSNLRTLCDRCNSGKSDKYDPDGLN